MTFACFCEFGSELTCTNGAGRRGGQDGGERGPCEAAGAGERLTCRNQQRAAIGDVTRHIGEVGLGDDAATFILVEDDEIEFIKLIFKKLICWKGDEGEFFCGCVINLAGRAQDGEVNQIDRWITF